MGLYIYENPQTGERIEIFQSVHDDHVYQENGHFWKRVFTIPNASIDTKVDPYSKKDFVKTTANKKGKFGEVLDLAAELSNARADKDGRDPVKEKFYENYAKERRGKQHVDVSRRDAKERLAKKGFEVEF